MILLINCYNFLKQQMYIYIEFFSHSFYNKPCCCCCCC